MLYKVSKDKLYIDFHKIEYPLGKVVREFSGPKVIVGWKPENLFGAVIFDWILLENKVIKSKLLRVMYV